MPFVVRSLYKPAQFVVARDHGADALAVADTRDEAEAQRMIALLERAAIEDFPPKMRVIATAVSKDAFLKLLRHAPRRYCGVAGREGMRLWVYVPAAAKLDHRLAEVLGMDDFERLVHHYARQVLHIANCSSVAAAIRNQAICDALVRGQAVADVAANMGLTARQVRNIARDALMPRSVRPLARVLGTRKAVYLIGQLPHIKAGVEGKQGRRVMLYVPKILPPDHRLIQILGAADAGRLVDAFGGETLYPANCNDYERRDRNRQIVRLAGKGVLGAELAEKFGLTTRSVRNILRDTALQGAKNNNDN